MPMFELTEESLNRVTNNPDYIALSKTYTGKYFEFRNKQLTKISNLHLVEREYINYENLINVLKKCKYIERLEILNSEFTNESFDNLCNIILEYTGVCKFTLEYCYFSTGTNPDELSRSLLKLINNKNNPLTALRIYEKLDRASYYTREFLNFNIEILLPHIQKSEHLQMLYLDRIREDDVPNIIEMIKNNTSIQSFNLGGICSEDYKQINSYVQRNIRINTSLANICARYIVNENIEVPDWFPSILIEQNT